MASERQEIKTVSPWWGEHIHRYEEVSSHLSGSESILDIACGTGFGTNLLAQKTKGNVFGGDIDQEAIKISNDTWTQKNLTYEKMDATKLRFEDNSFDVVVSFETIEHTAEYNLMLTELLRVTKPNGTLFISTPNILINSPTGIVTNPYHTQEWTFEELKTILTNIFPKVEIFGQKYARYNSNSFAKKVENLMYKKGIRKIPIKFQDRVMNSLISKPMYPITEDFELTVNSEEIKECKTFFCICKKQ